MNKFMDRVNSIAPYLVILTVIIFGILIVTDIKPKFPSMRYVPRPTLTITPTATQIPSPTPAPTKPPKRVVFLGGSITEGAAASSVEETSWTALLSRWLANKYSEYSWVFDNAGVPGTTSWYGLIRLQTDVIDRNPDIVYIDFAVNDSVDTFYPTPGNVGLGPAAEALIRRIRTSLPNAQIYVWIFTWPDSYSPMSPETRASRDKWVSLAQHYDIPLLRLDNAIEEVLGSDNPTDAQIDPYFSKPGDVHPNDEGHLLAAKYAEDHFGSINQPWPKLINEYTYLFPESIDYERTPTIINGSDLRKSGNWILENKSLASNTPGDEISYTGDICSFGFDTIVGADGAIVSWSIDGVESGKIDLTSTSISHRPIAAVPCGIHTLTIKVIQGIFQIYRLLII